MPSRIPLSGVEGEDFYPADEEDQKKIVKWVESAYMMAQRSKEGYKERWEKYYKMYRSYVRPREAGDWHERIWMPVAFYVIETITPRLVAQLPKMTVMPVGPEDAYGAELMEELLEWSADQTDLYLELVKALKSSLLYGTGILKVSYDERMRFQIRQEPVMAQSTTEVDTGQVDMDGQPIMQPVQAPPQPTGEVRVTRTPYVAYQGPTAEAVDIDNFFVDPVASSIEDARYVMHRVYRDRAYLEEMFERGEYHRPENDVWDKFLQEHATMKRQSLVGLGPGSTPEQDDENLIEVLEVWTDDAVVTVAGGDNGGMVLLRAERNPFAHGEKPFVRIVDHLVPHEFWGIGELEPLEGLQDILNKLWNARIDNVNLVLNSMFLAVMDYVVDPSDLQVRPGGFVRIREGVPLDQAVKPLNLGEVTGSSYQEGAEIERMTEKVSGVSPLQAGQDSPAYNRTATGAALISEQGNTRFTHKIRIAELTGFKHLARQFAAIIQQFLPQEMVMRIKGPLGQYLFQTITPDAIGGRFDFDIEGESSTQTESIRREQTLSLFQMLAMDPYTRPLKIREDVLKVFGRKNVQDYLLTEQELMMMMAQQQEQAALEAGNEEPVQSE